MKKVLLAALMLPVIGAYAQETTVKKVVLEDLTGQNCCWCPDGAKIAEDLKAANGPNFFPVGIHTSSSYTPANSPLRTPEGDAINTMAQPSGYPNGCVDRKKYTGNTTVAFGRGSWAAAINGRLALPAVVSVGFDNMTKIGTDSFEMDVKVKFVSAPAAGVPIKLQVEVLEDAIPATTANGLAQKNCTQTVQPGVTPLVNYFHNHVMRKALGGAWGFSDIPATPVVGTVYTKHVGFKSKAGASPVGWVTDNLSVLAFVAYDGTAAADQKEILNAEEVSIKQFMPLGINQVKNNVNVLSVYPNPATSSSTVRVEYSIEKSANVTMKVYNISGQVVAQPYSSYEVEGAHTLQWIPSGLSAGLYTIELATANGSMTYKFNIQ